jgi:hypothetical protein
MTMQRQYQWQRYALNTALGTTPPIRMGVFVFGRIYIPAGSPITSLTFYDCPNVDGVTPPVGGYTDTYISSFDSSSMTSPAAIVLTVAAGQSYPIPKDLAGSGSIKIVVNSAGSVDIGFKS